MKYKKNDFISVKVIQNEVFAFNRNTGIIHSFNSTGGFLLNLIVQEMPIDALIDNLIQEYEIDKETAQKDVIGFLQTLSQKGLININE